MLCHSISDSKTLIYNLQGDYYRIFLRSLCSIDFCHQCVDYVRARVNYFLREVSSLYEKQGWICKNVKNNICFRIWTVYTILYRKLLLKDLFNIRLDVENILWYSKLKERGVRKYLMPQHFLQSRGMLSKQVCSSNNQSTIMLIEGIAPLWLPTLRLIILFNEI